MATIQRFQTAFTAGAVDSLILARKDTQLYYLACQTLQNVIPLPQGPVFRRPGLRSFATSSSEGVPNIALIPRTAGTPIGNMTAGGGIDAAFDGKTSQSNTTGARRSDATNATIGKDWGLAKTRIITGFKIYSTNNRGFIGGSHTGATMTVTLQGSTDNFSSSTVDLGTLNVTEPADDVSVSKSLFTGIDVSTAYRYHRLRLAFTPSENLFLSEVEFYEQAGIPGAATDDIRLGSFVFNVDEQYLVGFTPGVATIWNAYTGEREQAFATSYTSGQLEELRWIQLADVMIVVHPEHEPQQIVRLPAGWSIEPYQLLDEDDEYSGPFHQFQRAGVTLDPNGTSGSVNVVSSEDYFEAGHVGLRMLIRDVGATVTAVADATHATVTLDASIANANKTLRWREQAFSALRGWPRSVALAQQRLVFGGSRDVPQRLWFSVSGDHTNFDLGEAEDDEAINISTQVGSINEIRHLVVGRGGLEVFTAGEEGTVPFGTDAPLTPKTISYTVHTRYGSSNARPAQIDGTTVFVQRDAGTTREFIWSEAEQGYIADSLSVRAPKLINAPVALEALVGAFGRQLDVLFVANGDGTMAILATLRAQQVAAWCSVVTDGQIKAVAVAAGKAFVAVQREGLDDVFSIEWFDPTAMLDAQVTLSEPAPATEFGPISAMADRDVDVIADGIWIGQRRVDSAGILTLEIEATTVDVGFDFAPRILPMPMDTAEGSMIGRPRHPFRAIVRVEDTAGLLFSLVDRAGTRRKTYSLPTKRFDGAMDQPVPMFTGDHAVRLIGWSRDGNVEVTQSGPFPMTILGFAQEVAVN